MKNWIKISMSAGIIYYNLQLLEGTENSAKKDKDPEVWLKEEYKNEQAIEEYKERLKEVLLP
ncbi:ancestral polypeptide [Helicobacter pylori]|nr:ancestral polypeptide [Helicobacter pylori]